jgi:hypothetical protein
MRYKTIILAFRVVVPEYLWHNSCQSIQRKVLPFSHPIAGTLVIRHVVTDDRYLELRNRLNIHSIIQEVKTVVFSFL